MCNDDGAWPWFLRTDIIFFSIENYVSIFIHICFINKKYVVYVWGWCILYVNYVTQTLAEGVTTKVAAIGGTIQYDPNMGGHKEGEGFIPSHYYCSDHSALEECRPPEV